MKKKIIYGLIFGLIILSASIINSCEIEEDPEWCASCATVTGLTFGFYECFDSRQEAEDYVEYLKDYQRSGHDISTCTIIEKP